MPDLSSPPGAPLTATAPMVMSPTLIGAAPMALIVPAIVAGGAAVPAGGGVTGPVRPVVKHRSGAFILAISVVYCGRATSRIMNFGALRPSTTRTANLVPVGAAPGHRFLGDHLGHVHGQDFRHRQLREGS